MEVGQERSAPAVLEFEELVTAGTFATARSQVASREACWLGSWAESVVSRWNSDDL